MTPEFSVKKLPNKETLGEMLEKKRTSLGYDYSIVERATKIRPRFLEAMEKGDFRKLPPETYTAGFVKNYARFLKLDPEKMAKLYRKELNKSVPQRKQQLNDRKAKLPRIVVTPKTLLIYGISSIALIVVLYIGWQVQILAAPPNLEIVSPENNITITEDSIEIEGRTDPGADVFINESLIGGSPDGTFKEKITLQDGLNVIKITSKNKIGKETILERNIAVTLNPIQPVTDVLQEIELRIDVGPNSAFLNVKVDGVNVEEEGFLMLSGASSTFKAKESVVISTKNAGSTNVTLNGRDIGPLGKEGEEIKNREFTKDLEIR